MFGKRVRLFTLLGFNVSVDASWLVIALLVAWSLATAYFPLRNPHLDHTTYWVMGALGALGLFVSIVVHEFAHSLVARKYGIPMKGITLFLFGGVAEMDEEPPTARSELWMAAAGPATSIGIGVAFYILYRAAMGLAWPAPLNAVLFYLSWINLLLAAFNLVPAFPLDGGRIFRAILWKRRGNLHQATRTASRIGSGFGIALMIFGGLNFIGGLFITGMWWALIGLFIRGASRAAYRQLTVREALAGEPVRRFMRTDPVTVEPNASLEQVVNDFVYKYHFRMVPVAENSHLLGCVDTQQIKQVPRDEWARHSVGELVMRCSEDNTIDADAEASKALAVMTRTGKGRLMVTDGGHLTAMVTLKDLVNYLNLREDLEGDGDLPK